MLTQSIEILAGIFILAAACFGAGFALGVEHGPQLRARRRRGRWAKHSSRRPGLLTSRTTR